MTAVMPSTARTSGYGCGQRLARPGPAASPSPGRRFCQLPVVSRIDRRSTPRANAVSTKCEDVQLKSANPFRDEWTLLKGDQELTLEFRDMNQYLMEEGVSESDAVRPRNVQRLMDEEGYTLVDVRIQWAHDEWYLEDAVHVPMQRVIEGNEAAKTWRKFGHALFVEFPPVEMNFPEWLPTMLGRFDPDDKILIGCNLGGLLDEDAVKRVSSDTFTAMYLLKNAGYTNVKYIKGGFCAWRSDQELATNTRGVNGTLPWFKTVPVLRDFFPAPCNWVHVDRCACKEDEECGGC